MSQSLLLILSASRFLAPDSPLLVLAPFLFSVHLHGMTFLFLSDINSLDPFKYNLKTFIFPKLETCHVFHSMLLSSSFFAACFKLCKLSFVHIVSMLVRASACMFVHAHVCTHACMHAFRIVSMDRTLHFVNTLVNILLQVRYSASYRNGCCHEGAAVHLFLHASEHGHPLLCLERHLQFQQVHSVGHAAREVLQSLTQLTAIQ